LHGRLEPRPEANAFMGHGLRALVASAPCDGGRFAVFSSCMAQRRFLVSQGRKVIWTLLTWTLLILSTSAFARERVPATGLSSCAVCHLASTSGTVSEHAWHGVDSPHAARGVGCEKCHGGDPLSTDPRQAHRDVLAPANFRSPVNPVNLVRTCGACHRANASAFAATMHQSLVVIGDRRAPTCVTCHSSRGVDVPTSAVLEARCAACHPRGSAREAYPALMRQAVDTLNQLRTRAEALGPTVPGTGDRGSRVDRLGLIFEARDILQEAVSALHRFDASSLTERLEAARQRLDATDALNTEFGDR